MSVKYRKLQLWKCKSCTHTFYTPVKKKQAWYRRLLGKPEKIKCPVCNLCEAVKKRIVTKEIRCEK